MSWDHRTRERIRNNISEMNTKVERTQKQRNNKVMPSDK